MPGPHLIATGDDGLALALVALADVVVVVRGTVAEDPDAGFVIKVRLAIDSE
jgi:hypothetical protein